MRNTIKKLKKPIWLRIKATCTCWINFWSDKFYRRHKDKPYRDKKWVKVETKTSSDQLIELSFFLLFYAHGTENWIEKITRLSSWKNFFVKESERLQRKKRTTEHRHSSLHVIQLKTSLLDSLLACLLACLVACLSFQQLARSSSPGRSLFYKNVSRCYRGRVVIRVGLFVRPTPLIGPPAPMIAQPAFLLAWLARCSLLGRSEPSHAHSAVFPAVLRLFI